MILSNQTKVFAWESVLIYRPESCKELDCNSVILVLFIEHLELDHLVFSFNFIFKVLVILLNAFVICISVLYFY